MLWDLFKKTAPRTPTSAAGTEKADAGAKIPLSFLQKLIPIGDLPLEKLRALPLSLRSFEPGSIVFTRGDQADSLPYLLAGEIFLETGSGTGYSVEASTFKACYPLSTESEHKFNAIAKTAVHIVFLPLHALQDSDALFNNPLINPEDTPQELRNSAFFAAVCQAYRKDELRVPNLPDVAIRLRRALQKEEISINDAVKIINLDPVMSSKLIQVVNSPLYGTLNPATNCHAAVLRLGLKTTQNLVTSISLNNLFRSTDKQLQTRIHNTWKQSIQVASLSHTLAALSQKLNPEEALLAGLTHNIGALPIITFAEHFDKQAYTTRELEATIATLQGLLSVAILKKWHFPEALQQIPLQIGNWYHTGGPNLQIGDIVLLAKFHSLLGTPQMANLPPLNTLPAFHKLGDTTLTPDMSLQALHDAKQQIAEALSFFKA